MFRCGTRLKILLPTPLADGLLPALPRPQGALAEAELPGKGRELSIFPVLAQQVQRVGLQAGNIAPPLMQVAWHFDDVTICFDGLGVRVAPRFM